MGTATFHVVVPHSDEDRESLLTKIAGKSGFVPNGAGADGHSSTFRFEGNDQGSDQLLADLRAGGFIIAEDRRP